MPQYANRSTTITAGGTAQILVPENSNRKRVFIQNPSAEVESLWIDFAATAVADSPSIELPPGSTFDTGSDPAGMSYQYVSAYAATTGHKIVCKELV